MASFSLNEKKKNFINKSFVLNICLIFVTQCKIPTYFITSIVMLISRVSLQLSYKIAVAKFRSAVDFFFNFCNIIL